MQLQQFLVRRKYRSLEGLYEFCSLTCNISSVGLFPVLITLGSL